MTRGTLDSGAVLLQKPKFPQLVNKFPAFYGTQRSIIAFTTARHLSLFLNQTNSVRVLLQFSFNIHFNITLPSTPRSSQQSLSYMFPLPPNTLDINVFSHVRATSPAHLISLDFNHYSASNTNREAPPYAILSNLPSVPLC